MKKMDSFLPHKGRTLRKAGRLQVLADLMWPIQALAISWVISAWVAKEAGSGPIWQSTGFWIAVFVFAGVVRALIGYRVGAMLFDMAQDLIETQRRKLIANQARIPFRTVSSAELAALAAEKIPLLGPYFTHFKLSMARVRIVPFVYLLIVFPISWVVAVIFLVAGPLIPLFMALIGMAAKDASEKHMAEVGDMNRLLIDRIAALPDARLLGGFKRSRVDFEASAERLRVRTMAVLRVAFLSSTVLELFAALGVALVAVYVGFSLLGEIGVGAWTSGLTLFEGLFLLLLAPEFFQPLRDMATAWHDKAGAEAVGDELIALEEAKAQPMLGDGVSAMPLSGAARIEMSDVVVLRGQVALGLPDFAAEAGQGVALVGPSGTGKTTMLETLAGLIPLEAGRIQVAGHELSDDTADAWRARLAFVPQMVHLPDSTLRGFLDVDGRGDIALESALKAAHAWELVQALPEGLETRLGEFGAGVSGGEARRLMLARAFMVEAEVILADEPTANLDAATAAKIMDTLCTAIENGAIVIAATHDPALMAVMGARVEIGGAGQ